MTRKPSFIVTGPGVEAGYHEVGPALSRSITEASKMKAEATFYVRNAEGDPVGYSESDEHGNVVTVQR